MKNHFLLCESEKSRILNLHESLRHTHGTSLLNEEKTIRPYKVGGKKFGSDEANNVYITLYIIDGGSGEKYVDVEEEGKTVKDVYGSVSRKFIDMRDSIKDDPQHEEYKKKYPQGAIELIKPPTLEEL